MAKTAMTGASRETTASDATSEKTRPQEPINPGEFKHMPSSQMTVHKLDGTNYLEWAQSMKLAIDGKRRMGYLTGTVRKPAADDPKLAD